MRSKANERRVLLLLNGSHESSTFGAHEVDSIVHQLASASLRGVQLEEVWRAEAGETHALVSLDVDRVRESVRSTPALSVGEREDLATRAIAAFEALDAAYASGDAEDSPETGAQDSPESD